MTEATGESQVDLAMIGSLVDISLARLDNQVSYIRDRSGQALTGVAINVALVTALLGIRATATSMALQAVPRFADRWWQPVVVFALATVFFIGVAATSSVRELPSPGELLSVLTARAERRRPLLILGALEAVYQDQDRRAWVPALLLFGGGILTFLAVAMCVLILFGVP